MNRVARDEMAVLVGLSTKSERKEGMMNGPRRFEYSPRFMALFIKNEVNVAAQQARFGDPV
jgi:hypothetical protein